MPCLHWLPNGPHVTSSPPAPPPALSAQRLAIRECLRANFTAATPREVAACTGYDYQCVRKMLWRLTRRGELFSPVRGYYTLSGHPCIMRFLNDFEPIPAPSNDPDDLEDEKHLIPLCADPVERMQGYEVWHSPASIVSTVANFLFHVL